MKARTWLLICSSVYLGLSFVVYHLVPSDDYRYEMDSGAYTNYVDRLERFGTFHDPRIVHTQEVPHISVGYPILLWVIRTVCGPKIYWIVLAQILLGIGIIAIGFRVACMLFSHVVAMLAAALLSINIGVVVYPQFVLTETLLSFLLVAGFERYVYGLHKKRVSAFVVSGLLFGYSMVVKPAALYLVPLLLLYALWYLPWRRGVQSVIVLGSMWMIPIVMYSSYHYVTYGSYTLSGAQYTNLYHYFLPKVLERSYHISDHQAREVIRTYRTHDGKYDFSRLRLLLLKMVTKYPVAAVQVWLGQVARTLFGLYTTQLKVLLYGHPTAGKWYSFWRFEGSWWQRLVAYLTFNVRDRWVVFLGMYELGYIALRTCSVLLAMGLLAWRRRWDVLVLCGMYVGYFALISGHDGCGRFRMMFQPVLTIVCAAGIVYGYEIVRAYWYGDKYKRVG